MPKTIIVGGKKKKEDMSLLSFVCCALHRSRIAVIKDDLTCVEMWTYSFLIERAIKIATYLGHVLGGREHAVVAIYGTSSPEVLAALLGVLAVPAAYMPVGPDTPAATKETLLYRHHVSAVLVELTLLEDFLSQDWNLSATLSTDLVDMGFVVARISWHVDSRATPITSTRRANPSLSTNPALIQELLDSYSSDVLLPQCLLCSERHPPDTSYSAWPLPSVSPTSIAYVLHTSGSTGEPKAVRVPHCCIVPNVLGLGKRFSVHPDDIVLNAAPLTFDPSVVEIFLALFSGSALLVLPPPLKMSPSSLSQIVLVRQHVTLLQGTPSLVRRVTAGPLGGARLLGPHSNLRVLALGGESFPSLEEVCRWGGEESDTQVFNVYGITEVSSWACCHHVQVLAEHGAPMDWNEKALGRGAVPIGDPLPGTRVELRTEEGPLEGCGRGEIWIGGVYRVCLLGDEEELVPGCMRPSGDIGYRDDGGNIYCIGRSDQQVKRAGHRVNLNVIQQVLTRSLDGISTCAVVAPGAEDIKHLSCCRGLHSVADDLTLLLLLVPLQSARPVDLDTLLRHVWTKMGQLLPSHCIPDDVIFVREIPITVHGKADTHLLLEELASYVIPTTGPGGSHLGYGSLTEVQEMLVNQAMEVLGLEDWPCSCSLPGLGVDSFGITRMMNAIERQLEAWLGGIPHLPLLGEVLMGGTVKEVADFILRAVGQVGAEGGVVVTTHPSAMKRSSEVGTSPPPAPKRTRDAKPALSWGRGTHHQGGLEAPPHVRLWWEDTPPSSSEQKRRCVLRQRWTVDTGKCVDSSPLVVRQEGSTPTTVYCGSHSGTFVAVSLHTGEVLWRRGLSDRTESSACLSACGEFVLVGCYDGSFYVLNRRHGDIHWCFQVSNGEPVKSSPAVDPTTGWVWFGSHDRHLYCLDILDKVVVFRLHLGGGSCFSSPCIAYGNRVLYTATLGGVVVAVDMDRGEVMWSFECQKPIFSSPCAIPGGGVAVGCVDGCVYMIDSEGHLMASYHTSGPVFSSCSCVVDHSLSPGRGLTTEPRDHQVIRTGSVTEPCDHQVTRTGPVSTTPGAPTATCYLYCGSHDKHVYCWRDQMELVWKREMDSEVYSIPFMATLPPGTGDHKVISGDDRSSTPGPHRPAGDLHSQEGPPCLCVCTVSGQVCLLHPSSGALLGRLVLPGQVYSSPVLVEGVLVVGCRDNNLYCIEVELCSN